MVRTLGGDRAWMRSQGGTLMMAAVPLEEDRGKTSLPCSLLCEDTIRRWQWETWRGTLTDLNHAGRLVWDLQPQGCDNQLLLFLSHLVDGPWRCRLN